MSLLTMCYCGGRDMRAMVMLLWSCSYTVMLTSLRESFMEGRGERNGEEQERERQQTKFNIRKTLRPFVLLSFEQDYFHVFLIMVCFAKLHHLSERGRDLKNLANGGMEAGMDFFGLIQMIDGGLGGNTVHRHHCVQKVR